MGTGLGCTTTWVSEIVRLSSTDVASDEHREMAGGDRRIADEFIKVVLEVAHPAEGSRHAKARDVEERGVGRHARTR
jgi:hypothetical protein